MLQTGRGGDWRREERRLKREGRAEWNGGKMMEVKRSEQVEKQEDGRENDLNEGILYVYF
jgi:hypothetical protein